MKTNLNLDHDLSETTQNYVQCIFDIVVSYQPSDGFVSQFLPFERGEFDGLVRRRATAEDSLWHNDVAYRCKRARLHYCRQLSGEDACIFVDDLVSPSYRLLFREAKFGIWLARQWVT